MSQLIFKTQKVKCFLALPDICEEERHTKTPYFLNLKACFSKYGSGLLAWAPLGNAESWVPLFPAKAGFAFSQDHKVIPVHIEI